MPEVLTETKGGDLLDLDKRVALALGFKPTVTWAIFNADETALMIDFSRRAEAVKWWDEHPSVHAEHHIGELEQYEPYSTNIEAAIRVEDRIAELDLRKPYLFELGKIVAREATKAGEIVGYWHFTHATAEQRCRAALAAIENKQ